MRGFWLVRWFRETPPAGIGAAIEAVFGLMAQGAVDPPVEARYDLGDGREAVVHAERPGRAGKVLLVG